MNLDADLRAARANRYAEKMSAENEWLNGLIYRAICVLRNESEYPAAQIAEAINILEGVYEARPATPKPQDVAPAVPGQQELRPDLPESR